LDHFHLNKTIDFFLTIGRLSVVPSASRFGYKKQHLELVLLVQQFANLHRYQIQFDRYKDQWG
jgi:hypothetical protein